MKKKDLNQFKREIKSTIKEHYNAPIDMFSPTFSTEATESILDIVERAYEQWIDEGSKQAIIK